MHECPRCHYSTNHKHHMINHLKKKIVCPNTFSDASVEETLEVLLAKKVDSKYICPDCSKCFSHSSSLSRHKKEHLNINVSSNSNNNTSATHSHNPTVSNSHNNTTNSQNNNSYNPQHSYNTTNNTTHNTTNNYNIQHLHVFGEEDLSHLVEEILTKRLKEILSHNGLSALVRDIHFNDEVPQNKNVKLVKERHPSTMKVWIRDEATAEECWKEMYSNDVLDMLIDTKTELLVKHNNNIIRLAQDEIDKMTGNDKEKAQEELRDTCDMRYAKLSGIKSTQKKRGLYGKVKGNIYSEIRTAKLNDRK